MNKREKKQLVKSVAQSMPKEEQEKLFKSLKTKFVRNYILTVDRDLSMTPKEFIKAYKDDSDIHKYALYYVR